MTLTLPAFLARMRGDKVDEGATVMTYEPTAEAMRKSEPKAQLPF